MFNYILLRFLIFVQIFFISSVQEKKVQQKSYQGLTNSVSNKFINVRSFGVRGDGVTDETALIQKAINSLREGDTLFFPVTNFYVITAPLIINTNDVIIKGENESHTIIKQTQWGMPVFDVSVKNDVTISNLSLFNSAKRQSVTGVFRGHNKSSYCAGIWLSGNNNVVSNLHVRGFVAGVFLNSFNVDGNSGFQKSSSGNTLSHITAESVDFAVLFSRQKNCTISNITGTYSSSQLKEPPHLIYGIGNSDNITIKNCYAFNGKGGHAFQLKNLDHSTIDNLTAKNCDGILSLVDCSNSSFKTINSINDSAPQYSIFMQRGKTGNIKNNFSDIKILKSPKSNGLGITIDGNYNTFSDITIVTGDISNRSNINRINGGINNDIENINIDATKSSGNAVAFSLSNGSNHVVKNLSCKNVAMAITSEPGVVNCTVEYKPASVKTNSKEPFLFKENKGYSLKKIDR